MATKFKTVSPEISDAALARIRAAAHRFVIAGGSIFPNDGPDQAHQEHVGNALREFQHHDSAAVFSERLNAAVTDFTTHEQIYDAAWLAIGEHVDAAFLFGAFVGLEFASLTFCQLATLPTMTRKDRR